MISLLILLGLIGLALGSYAATAGLRLARGEQSLQGRSRCDHCGVHLSFARTVPVLAYVGQAGACRDCGGLIDPAHLIGEAAGAAIMALSFWLFTPLKALSMAALGLVLLTTAVVDAKSRRLPDALTVVAALLCACLAAQESLMRLWIGMASAVLAFGLLEGLRRAYLRFRGQAGLGAGDVKLIAALALWLGIVTPWALTLAAVLGLAAMAALRPRDGRLAFGPAIALAGWSVGVMWEAQPWPGLA